ncbi:T9SS type A sorting domain-containing protein [Flavobacterium silvaticum]|uniref:T9SS type A sorting domain-containing protein n=1 Tax=Flavobacterium silvaticum TaxID=1852020 RepID=A0A972JJ26_9FLAO|nr:T9SS type A sorting domain-containing protein [Flavobacterium silvaticum]NMH27792.1 T9SS type A sorting domain-containing protein [Flavobacterium silvaticum]
MRKTLFVTLLFSVAMQGQALLQTVNSGSVIAASSAVSVGEIVVIPENQIQSQSGIIGILTESVLEVKEYQVYADITVYPNPTTSGIYFKSGNPLVGEKVSVYAQSGQKLLSAILNTDYQLDLSSLSSGVYLIQSENKKFKSFKIVKH